VKGNTPVVDENEQCPFCGRWFKEGQGINWHIRSVHGANSATYHELFKEGALKAAKTKMKRRAKKNESR
jgi:hypothetical protein